MSGSFHITIDGVPVCASKKAGGLKHNYFCGRAHRPAIVAELEHIRAALPTSDCVIVDAECPNHADDVT